MNLPEILNVNQVPDGVQPYGVFRGSHLIAYTLDIEEARSLMRDHPGSHVQYYYTTPDVLRHEDLFDKRVTNTIIKILEGNSGLRNTVVGKAYAIRIDEGELHLKDVYEILLESEESWVGINLNKVCIQTIRGWILTTLDNGNY